MKNTFFLLLVVSASGCFAQWFPTDTSVCFLRDASTIREHNVDFIKMNLDVSFNVKAGKVTGKVSYSFKPIQPAIDTLFLDAPGISVKSVLLNNIPVEFDTSERGLTIRFSKPLSWNNSYTLQIAYEATPRKGLYFIGWNVSEAPQGLYNSQPDMAKNENYKTRKQIWTQGQGIDNRHWIPCYDDVNDKMLVETKVTFDSAYTVIANGVLKEKRLNPDKTFTWHYQMNKPMVPYLIMIAIDKFAYKDYKSKNGMVSRQYYYADRPETREPTYRYSAEMMDWLVEQTGVAYPWQTYANVPVQDFMYGAMENTTATIYGDFYLCDKRVVIERPYIATNAHELTHQWFGDYVTEYSATHHWLHESFATYYAKQFIHHVYGEDRYQADRRGEQLTAIYADRTDRYPVAHSRGGSNRHYPKGSAVIDMLRYVVGDSVFNKCVSAYLKKHAYSNVLSDDFKMAFMETAGINLDWFFEEWIYRSGFPNYQVSYQQLDSGVAIYISQIQKTDELTGYFKMPVNFEVYYADGSIAPTKAWLMNANDTVFIRSKPEQQIDFVLFDPSSNIIKTVDFRKTYKELALQATKAKHMIDRLDAIVALRDSATDLKRDLLAGIFLKGDYTNIKNEILYQLADDSTAVAKQVFIEAFQSPDFLVRRTALDEFDNFADTLLPEAEKLLTDTSYYTIENALRKLCDLYPDNTEKYMAATKGVMGINNNVFIAWLELNAQMKTNDSTVVTACLAQLTEYTSNRYEFRTRVKAMDALERLAYLDVHVAANLFNAIANANNRLSGPATRTLKKLIKNPGNYSIAANLYQTATWYDWEMEKLAPLFVK